ncbi:MAG: DUF3877 family protein [Lachnobacterium sp.]|nr:DUF3877 family protein [Lachnobacterium sp.]
MHELDYSNLERSLIDVIKEEQAKLGYYREDIRLYYPLSSLNHFLGTDVNADKMQKILEGTGENVDETRNIVEGKEAGSATTEPIVGDKEAGSATAEPIVAGMNARLSDKLGMVEVSHKGDRFCFHILPEGVEYVHENTKENEFIRELVNLVAKHGCTIDQIYELFTAHSDRVGREKMDNGEFDERIWFQDDADDPYYYCFKQEGGHMIYHRFLPEDYEDFEF